MVQSSCVALCTSQYMLMALAFLVGISMNNAWWHLTSVSTDPELDALIQQTVEDRLNSLRIQQALRPETGQANKTYPFTKQLQYDQMKRILVTGGAGFIGSNLVDVLMIQGHFVIVLDNLFTGRKKNIQHWMGHPQFEFIRGDVVDPIKLEVDQIYHLACPASPPHYQYNPIKTIKTSTEGTLNMLGLAKRVKARILFASTSEVYGDPLEHPQKETYFGNVNTMGPRSCYDEGKRLGETLCHTFNTELGVEIRIARIFNTFGPRMHPDDGRVVSNFIIQALKGERLTIYGEGHQTRSFQYVSDLVRGLILLMNSEHTGPINLGNPEESTIKDFALQISGAIRPGLDGEKLLLHMPAKQDDPSKRKPDISLALKILGWKPEVPVSEGLATTIGYFKQEIGMGHLSAAESMVWMNSKVIESLPT